MITGTVWAWWAAIVIISFLTLELVGWHQRKVEGTLSFRIWKILFYDWEKILEGKRPKHPRGVIYFVVMSPFVWVTVHFMFGGALG